MEKGLGFDNILGEQEIDTLFESPEEAVESKEEVKDSDTKEEDNENEKTTEVVNPEELFDDSEDTSEEKQPEGVGSEKKEDKEKEDAVTDNDSGASPNQNFYSSIASAMAVDGIFPNLTDDNIKKAVDAESFSELVESEINARLDEKQQRVSRALDNGVEPDDIRRYENTLEYINKLTDAQLSEEGEKGESIRRSIIYQDFINKGYPRRKPRSSQKGLLMRELI